MKFFYLQKSDRRVILLLLGIIVAALVVGYFFDGEPEEAAMEEVPAQKAGKQQHPKASYYQGEPKQPELFPFDPNTADSTQLLRLGLRQLEPYIRISEDYQPAARFISKDVTMEERDTMRYPVKLQPQERIVLNTADTAQLRKVPGIGHYFARKIVEYRERLGGYVSVQQLLEIEDFPDTAVNYFIIPDDTQLRKLNLNRLSLNELKRHPYISFYQARAIVDYRRLHGPLESLQQLSLSRDFPPEAIRRLAPYVEF